MIIDFQYYHTFYDDISEQEFPQIEAAAELRIKRVIGPIKYAAISTQDTFYVYLKACACEVAHYIKQSQEAAGRLGVKSISNDGYSETYAATTLQEYEEEAERIIKRALSGCGYIGAY